MVSEAFTRSSRPTSIIVACLLACAACESPPPEFEEPPAVEVLYQTGLDQHKGRRILGILPWANRIIAIETFQSIIDNYPYSDYAVLAELRIADAYFEDRKYEEALSYYRDFSDLHPRHTKVPYTIYRSALCHERRMRGANRDQTATRDALVYLDQLLLKYPHSEYAPEAESLWRELRTHLAENAKQIADFYMNRKEYESAAARYRSLLNEYPGLGMDAQALYKLGVCYVEMRRREEAQQVFQSIVQNYRNSDYAGDAEKRIAALTN